MNKDRSITNLLKNLKLNINFDQLQVVDYWEADFCAIGLKRDNKLVYISTYNQDGGVVKYDYDLEILDGQTKDEVNVIKEVRASSENELLEDIKMFLEV